MDDSATYMDREIANIMFLLRGVVKSATTGDHGASLLQYHTSHPPFPHSGKIGRLGCSECVELFPGIHQCLRTQR